MKGFITFLAALCLWAHVGVADGDVERGSVRPDEETTPGYHPAEPSVSGACCLANSSCVGNRTLLECAALGGWASHSGTDCSSVACPGLSSPAQFLVDALDFNKFKQDVAVLAAMGGGSRFWNRPGNTAAVNKIKNKLESFGYDNVVLDPYVFGGQTKHNVYATKIGTVRPREMYILGAHLDSFNKSGDFDDAPGADDDASGVASVLAMARVFAQARTDISVRFVLWNNEETGLNGSRAYVENHRALQGTLEEPTWLGMIQQDMILFDHGPGPIPDADVEYQAANSAGGAANVLAQFIAGAMSRYGTIPAQVGNNMDFTDSVPFSTVTAAISVRENQRVAEIGSGSNPHWHQPTDLAATYSEADYQFGFNIVKMICGGVGELVGATPSQFGACCDGSTGICTDDVSDSDCANLNPQDQFTFFANLTCLQAEASFGPCTGCGDGVLTADEECDNGAANSDTTPDACRTDCTNPRCGDNVTDTGEECDDGNTVDGDGTCQGNCKNPICGEGIVDPGEECDDANANNNDDCIDTCKNAVCGDGSVHNQQSGTEQCDDGGDSSSCDSDCTFAQCGDGTTNGTAGEECDDGNNDRFDGCDPSCIIEFCGDGIRNNGRPPLVAGEDCDDGGTADGDGCDSDCRFEGSVPTVSQWGMVALATLLLIGLTVKFRRRSTTTA
ncbi:MAG: M20/M25/M40 family metallo-hydrolase [Phycisphaerae bacterium]